MPRTLLFTISLFMGPLAFGQRADMIGLPELQKLLHTSGEKITVVNFWATWCGPCVKELPLFDKIFTNMKDVQVALVSMDIDLDPNPEKVRSFVAKKKILAPVYILNEQNPNEWISQIENSWSGALPATIIINQKTGKRTFIERELHSGELEKLIEEIN